MNNKTNQHATEYFNDSVPYIMEGQVVSTADPDQMGRIKVWVPSLDGENFTIEKLPWVDYAAPFFGFTVDYPAGNGTSTNKSHTAYGMWAIPKVGATVLVFCLNADPTSRYYFASTLRLHRNRSLPAGRNTDAQGKIGPYGDAGDARGNLNPIEPAFSNLRAQFNNKIDSPQALSRGVYERQVAQPKNEKNGKEGYAPNPADKSYLDPQTYCFVTPGRHALIMQDDPQFARMRLKTAEGHQIILDDANERIYVSTAKGNTWIELDEDGHVHVYGSESISVRSEKDINIIAEENINMKGKNIYLNSDGGTLRLNTCEMYFKATKNLSARACGDLDLISENSIFLTANSNIDQSADNSIAITASDVNLTGASSLKQTSSRIDLNGPEARKAKKSSKSDSGFASSGQSVSEAIIKFFNTIKIKIFPSHEPWVRPESSKKRGPNWKE